MDFLFCQNFFLFICVAIPDNFLDVFVHDIAQFFVNFHLFSSFIIDPHLPKHFFGLLIRIFDCLFRYLLGHLDSFFGLWQIFLLLMSKFLNIFLVVRMLVFEIISRMRWVIFELPSWVFFPLFVLDIFELIFLISFVQEFLEGLGVGVIPEVVQNCLLILFQKVFIPAMPINMVDCGLVDLILWDLVKIIQWIRNWLQDRIICLGV